MICIDERARHESPWSVSPTRTVVIVVVPSKLRPAAIRIPAVAEEQTMEIVSGLPRPQRVLSFRTTIRRRENEQIYAVFPRFSSSVYSGSRPLRIHRSPYPKDSNTTLVFLTTKHHQTINAVYFRRNVWTPKKNNNNNHTFDFVLVLNITIEIILNRKKKQYKPTDPCTRIAEYTDDEVIHSAYTDLDLISTFSLKPSQWPITVVLPLARQNSRKQIHTHYHCSPTWSSSLLMYA